MKKLLIPYIMGNSKLVEHLQLLDKVGADFIEIGLPFSDPVADGDTIVQAGQDAIKEGVTTQNVLTTLNTQKDTIKTPYLLMTYYQLIEHYGIEKFIQEAENANVYGLIIPDLPYELGIHFKECYLKNSPIKLISLIAMTTSDERMKAIAKQADGFIYTVTMNAITGDSGNNFHKALADKVAMIKTHSNVPVVCGFGIRSIKDVQNIIAFSDGVVIGSELVKRLSNEPLSEVENYLISVREALDK